MSLKFLCHVGRKSLTSICFTIFEMKYGWSGRASIKDPVTLISRSSVPEQVEEDLRGTG